MKIVLSIAALLAIAAAGTVLAQVPMSSVGPVPAGSAANVYMPVQPAQGFPIRQPASGAPSSPCGALQFDHTVACNAIAVPLFGM